MKKMTTSKKIFLAATLGSIGIYGGKKGINYYRENYMHQENNYLEKNNEVSIFVWNTKESEDDGIGHVALDLGNGYYVSYWPKDDVDFPDKNNYYDKDIQGKKSLPGIFSPVDSELQTYQQDVDIEQKGPDKVIKLFINKEKAIKYFEKYKHSFKKKNDRLVSNTVKYCGVGYLPYENCFNCVSFVSDILYKGGELEKIPFIDEFNTTPSNFGKFLAKIQEQQSNAIQESSKNINP